MSEDIWLDFKKPSELIIVHCGLDGIAAAISAIVDGFKGDIYTTQANVIDMKLLDKYGSITIVDTVLPREEMMKRKNVVVYDHHIRNIWINEFPLSEMDARYCSSRIFYKNRCMRNECLEDFLSLVELIVHWKRNSNRFNNAIELVHLFEGLCATPARVNEKIYSNTEIINSKYKHFISSCYMNIVMRSKFEFSIADKFVISKQKEKLDVSYYSSLLTLQMRRDKLNRLFGICTVNGNKSLVLEKVLRSCEEMKYVIGYENRKTEMVRVYARAASDDVDLNQLEGLEGHPSAAGGMFKRSFIDNFIKSKNMSLEFKTFINTKFERGITPSEMKSRCVKK